MHYYIILALLVAVCSASHLEKQDKHLTRINLVRHKRVARDEFIFGQQFASVSEEHHLNRMNMVRSSGFSYIGEIQVGTPGKLFRVLLDSGSGELWLPTSSCRDVDHNIIATYNCRQSSSFTNDGRPISLKYINGVVVEGYLAREFIQFGDLAIHNQTFIQIDRISNGSILQHFNVDGILGLNFETISNYTDMEPPILGIMRLAGRQSGGKGRSMLSLSLNHGQDARRAGQLIFGDLDESLYVGQVAWAPLMRSKHWQFRVESIQLNYPEDEQESYWETTKRPDVVVCPHGCNAMADTGSMVIIGPPNDIQKLNEAIGAYHLGRGHFALPSCDNIDTQLPVLRISISGKKFSLTPRQYTFTGGGPNGPMCYSSFVIMKQNMQHWVLGNMFIGHFYTILDYDNERFGMAESIYKTPMNIADH